MKKVPLLLLALVLVLPFTEVRCTFGSSAHAESVSHNVMPEVTVAEVSAGASLPH